MTFSSFCLRVTKNSRHLMGILIVAFLILSIFSQSRAFTLGFTIALIFFISASGLVRISKSFACFLSLAVLLILTFLFKTGSSQGRMLIYKVSFEMWKENWLSGVGLGNFKKVYLQYQGQYFSSGEFSKNELMLADNTYYAFNDYFQVVLETGIVGLILVVLVFAIILWSIKKVLVQTRHPVLLWCISLLISILVAACFSHLLEKSIFQVIVCTILFIILYYHARIAAGKIFVSHILLLLFTLIMVWHIKGYQERLLIDNNFKTANEYFMAGYHMECIQELSSLRPVDDQKRISIYVQSLFALGSEKYERDLLTLIDGFPNSSLSEMMGDFYLKNGEYSKAELHYVKAINMVPNRFIPRYRLFNLYVSTRQNHKARMVGNEILNLPIKVNSFQIRIIQQSVKNLLHTSII